MVAERFGKQHFNVLRDIENLITQNRVLIGTYFIQSTYKAGTGKNYKEYLMTRDGFTLLAKGFTGKEALQFKLAYIEAFNKMEEQLKDKTPKLGDGYSVHCLYSTQLYVIMRNYRRLSDAFSFYP